MKDDCVNKNYQFFEQNLEELKKKYLDEYLIIQDEEVKFHDKDFKKAINYATDLKAGTYIIQKCEEEDEIQMFHSRVLGI